VGDEPVKSQLPESLEELSGEWMRQQLQEAAANTRPPSPEPARKPEPLPRVPWPAETAAAPPPPPPPTAAPPPPAPPRPAPPTEQPAAADDDVLVGLAQSVSQAVVGAVSQLEHRRSTEKQLLEQAVREQEQRLQGAVQQIAEIQGRFEKLAQMIEQQHGLAQDASEAYGRIAGEIAEVRRLEGNREGILEELRRETLDLSVSVSDRQDQLSGRLDLQQSDIEGLKSELAQLKPSIEQAGERLGRHSAAIRAIFEAEKRRQAALEQLSEAASTLRNSSLHYPEGLSEELL